MTKAERCPECQAWLYGHAHSCAKCGWGASVPRVGIPIQAGLFVHGGGNATYPPVQVDEDPYAEMRAVENRERQDEARMDPLTDEEITQHDVPDDAA